MKLYVASSWRNERQQDVVKRLREAGHEVYDFRDADGFHWSQVDSRFKGAGDGHDTPAAVYLDAIRNPLAVKGFQRDFQAMDEADACVLVLPCGKSAHLEAGYMAGEEKAVYVLLDDPMQPELMYGLLDGCFIYLDQLIEAL